MMSLRQNAVAKLHFHIHFALMGMAPVSRRPPQCSGAARILYNRILLYLDVIFMLVALRDCGDRRALYKRIKLNT